jgi:dipeptidyl aminopeptidase/acylaminoacyl peptidase
MKRTCALLVCLLFIIPAFAGAPKKRPMTIDDLFRFKRVSDPQISPDGKRVVYVITTVDDVARNKTSSRLWLAPTSGGKPRLLTNAGKHDKHPRWSPDGKYVLFESDRSGDSQLWVIAVDGGEARQLTTIATEAHQGIWSPDGKQITFVSAVWPEYSTRPYKESNELNRKRKEKRDRSPVKARVFTRLFFRHWDEWVEDKRQHLFVMEVAPQAHGLQPVGLPRDVTPGDRDANPTSDTFSAGDDFTFSPDGKYLLFTAVPAKHEAWSTNYDICRVPVALAPSGGRSKLSGGRQPPEWETLTKDNPAADGTPRFSPDGKWLAYRAQKRPGFEADRWQLMIVESNGSGDFKSKPRSITSDFDGSPETFVWAENSKAVLFIAEESALAQIFVASLEGGKVHRSSIRVPGTRAALTTSHGKLAYTHARLTHPPEVHVDSLQEQPMLETAEHPVNVSQANSKLLAELDLPNPQTVIVPVAGIRPPFGMQMWILKPSGFDPSKKWPLVYLVHGGPQGAWTDGWSYRWNSELWAAQGYVVALPNPRGSTGFGQKYVNEISGDWGGKCYDDLMTGVAYLEKQPWIDRERLAAAGASFGGYMMNWFAVNTGKFKTLISHAGVWDFDSMYATTDELWFDEYEHGGPPWGKDRESYERFSPHKKAANLGKFKTPMLVIQNDLDFRCPVSQGLELFTTLQRQGVPSRMINFPDEGHWVLKPANSRYWHQEVFGWLKKYVPPGGR